jgi:hypothetical protein
VNAVVLGRLADGFKVTAVKDLALAIAVAFEQAGHEDAQRVVENATQGLSEPEERFGR